MLWVLYPAKAVFEGPMLWGFLLPKPCAPCLPSTRPFVCSDGRAGEKFWISLRVLYQQCCTPGLQRGFAALTPMVAQPTLSFAPNQTSFVY